MAGADGLSRKERSKLQGQIDTIKQAISKPQSKLTQFWTSTPVWGVAAVLLTLYISPRSVKVVYFLAWVILCSEFVRVGFFESNRSRRYVVNTLFSVSLAILIIIGWPYLPKPGPEPDFDRSLQAFGDKLMKKINDRSAEFPPATEIARGGGVEVYFGSPGASRGTEVQYKNQKQKQDIFDRGAKGGAFNARVLTIAPQQQYEDVTIWVRNNSDATLANIVVTISSNRLIDAITPGVRYVGKGGDLEYSFPDLKQFRKTGDQKQIVVRISTKSNMFDPTPLLVTVDGKDMAVPHSEIAEYTFMPLPS
jgi:hypothetical protein